MLRSNVRPIKFGISGMESPPENELGVVCLFALIHRRLGFWRIKSIRQRFPDCVAIQRDGSREKEVRIEFEFRSSDFRKHKHLAKGCDYIVCWEHDWIHTPESLQGKVIELRKFLGMGRDVWLQPIGQDRWDWHDQTRVKTGRWLGPPARVKKGDLVLWYCTSPRSCIAQVCLLIGDPRADKDADRWTHSVDIKVLARLDNPVTFRDLKTRRELSGSTFMKAKFLGQFQATSWWPPLYHMITSKNPSARKELKKHAPEML